MSIDPEWRKLPAFSCDREGDGWLCVSRIEVEDEPLEVRVTHKEMLGAVSACLRATRLVIKQLSEMSGCKLVEATR